MSEGDVMEDYRAEAPERIAVGVTERGALNLPRRAPEDPDKLYSREVEYVRADLHQGAVGLLRRVEALDLGSNPPDAVLAVLIDVEDWLRSLAHPGGR